MCPSGPSGSAQPLAVRILICKELVKGVLIRGDGVPFRELSVPEREHDGLVAVKPTTVGATGGEAGVQNDMVAAG